MNMNTYLCEQLFIWLDNIMKYRLIFWTNAFISVSKMPLEQIDALHQERNDGSGGDFNLSHLTNMG